MLNKPTFIKLLLCILALTMASACATITRGDKDTLVIESDPVNADATLSNGLQCKTPCSIKLPRKDNCVVKIEKEGYESVEVNVTPQISGNGQAGMAGNILFGGLIGVAVDAGSGAMYDLKPNPVTVKLEKKPDVPVSMQQSTDPPAAAIREKTTAERLDELNKQGVISKDEYKRAKDKIAPTQTDDAEIYKKLQGLEDLRKNGVLSEEDYNKAKKRLTELQKLNELRQSGTLSEEEYNKAKARLSEKRDGGKEL